MVRSECEGIGGLGAVDSHPACCLCGELTVGDKIRSRESGGDYSSLDEK